MKILISFLVLVVLNENVSSYGSDTDPTINRQFTPEGIFQLLSEQVRSLIINGDVDNGIPILDPFEFQWRQMNFAAEEQYTDYRLQQLNFSKSDISIEINIDIPYLRFHSEQYELDGNIYEAIPIKGEGIVDIEIQKISLWGKVYLKQSSDGKSILVDKIEDPEFSIERVVSRTQFDNNIDGVISSMVEDLLAEYLTRFSKYIATSYADYIPLYLNPTLDNYENWNLLATLLYDEFKY